MENADTDSVLQEGRECTALHLPQNAAVRISANVCFPSKIDASLPVRAVVGDLEAISSRTNLDIG
jgi:hypothetical protein